MRNLFLSLACMLFATSVWAQTETAVPQPQEKKKSIAGFETNGFWDNWEISASAGAGSAFISRNNAGSYRDRIGFTAGFSVTKWIHPVFGARLGLQGGKFSNVSDGTHEKVKWPYLFLHVDGMVNLSNWIGGYRDDRVYYAVPYAGFGYLPSGFTDDFHTKYGKSTSQMFAFNVGLLNKFRVCKCLDITLELQAIGGPQKSLPVARGGSYALMLTAQAGVTYRFNQRTFRKASPYTVEDIMVYQQAVEVRDQAISDAQDANARLASDLNNARAEANRAKAEAQAANARAEKAAKTAMYAPARPADQLDGEDYTSEIYLTSKGVTFFGYSSSQLNDKEKVRLDIIAEQIKNGPSEKVYLIEGHADANTGSKAGNKRVAENRAKNVYNYLVSKGVKPEQLNYKGYGSSKSPFRTPSTNRVTVIR